LVVVLGCVATIGLGASCNNFLNPKPSDVLTTENFYKTAEDAVAAVNAVYGQCQYLYLYFFYVSDISGDDVIATANFGSDGHQLADYTFDRTLSWFDYVWTNSYQAITQANIVLQRVPSITMDTTERRRILGEAHFLRALLYFNLVRFYSDVPLVLTPLTSASQAQLPRTPAATVYAQIITDLDTAIVYLPLANTYSGTDVGRASQGAAQALLAKVYLTQGNWTQAAAEAATLIQTGQYSLNTSWLTSFQVSAQLTNPEDIFQIFYASPTEAAGVLGSIVTLFNLPSGYPGGDAYGLMQAIPSLVSSYSATDVRGNHGGIMISPYTDLDNRTTTWTVPAGAAFHKWLDETNAQNMTARAWEQQGNSWIILRYADVLLMYAEAVNEGGTPVAGLTRDGTYNQVLLRADPSATPEGGLGQDDFRDSLRVQRRKEFLMEGQRWFDLSRWGVLDSTITAKTTEIVALYPGETTVHGVVSNLFPIPQTEINVDPKLTQNPGY
jgi:hypothetical protein